MTDNVGDVTWQEPGEAISVEVQCARCGRLNFVRQLERILASPELDLETSYTASEVRLMPKDEEYLSVLAEIFQCGRHEIIGVDRSGVSVVRDKDCEGCGNPLDVWELRAQLLGVYLK